MSRTITIFLLYSLSRVQMQQCKGNHGQCACIVRPMALSKPSSDSQGLQIIAMFASVIIFESKSPMYALVEQRRCQKDRSDVLRRVSICA